VAKTPGDLVKAFADTTKFAAGFYTGGKTPYHFWIQENGQIGQLVPLAYNVPGAVQYNARSIQIAWERDTRKVPLKAIQRDAVIWLCATLNEAFGGNLKIVGHTEEAAASTDPNKVCPGNKTSLTRLRQDIVASTDDIHVLNPYTWLKNHGFEIKYG